MGGISFKEKAGGIITASGAENLSLDLASYIWKANTFTTVNNATQTVSISGLLATDFAIAMTKTLGTGSRYVLSAVCSTDTLTITMSGAPGTNTVVAWAVFRPL